MKFTGKDAGNKLERDVLRKLQDPIELSYLKADSLIYYHIYGDLYMLSKLKELGLTVLSMTQHYLELQLYLLEVMKHPDVVFKQNYPVFTSEKRIYGTDSKLNHRLKSPIVYSALFEDVKSMLATYNHCLSREQPQCRRSCVPMQLIRSLVGDTGIQTSKYKMY